PDGDMNAHREVRAAGGGVVDTPVDTAGAGERTALGAVTQGPAEGTDVGPRAATTATEATAAEGALPPAPEAAVRGPCAATATPAPTVTTTTAPAAEAVVSRVLRRSPS